MSDFFAWLEPVALGALGAVIGWITAEFVGKPVRAFFDLKKECIEILIHFGNVSALPVELRSNMFRPRDPQVEAIKKDWPMPGRLLESAAADYRHSQRPKL
ncbi:hypothetical protein [Bradyrhizobium sp. CCBAU 21360]|uniref:hypothetical protein n=1 Tax=Bradyrhizobium sp. CCBAU 21360 TaxID=1325081 RepID=UPI0023063BB1|nr:hypothetical protein [Bradyrhizobium sp. CCBAU 21360]